jgi:mannan endo-1,4-beta-mannosidase
LRNAPDSEEKSNYRKELMSVGNALKQLKQQGIIVLWRPFHEMNGSWYWWGANERTNPSNRTDYLALWEDMYDTFTKELKLDNLIWVYGPNASSEGYTQPVDYYYPGAKYVDIVGVDIYSKLPEFKDYETLKKLNKIVVVSEIGPSKEGYGKYDEMEIIAKLMGKAAWFLQWHSWKDADVAIIDNLRFKEMMNSPSAITLKY